MYYKAKVLNLAPTSLDAPIFAISRDEKVGGDWKQVEYRENHELTGKLIRVFYDAESKYPKLNLRFKQPDDNIIIYKTSMGKTVRNLIYKLSAPEKIDNVTLKANRFEGKDKEGKTNVIRYIAVFVDGQKWDNPFDKDDQRIKPKVIESSGKFYGYDWEEVDKFIYDTVLPSIQDKLVNKYVKEEAYVPVKREEPLEVKAEDVLPF